MDSRFRATGLEPDSDTLELFRTELQRGVVEAVLEYGSIGQRFLVIQAVEQTETLHYLLALVKELRDRGGQLATGTPTRFGRVPIVVADFRSRGDLLATVGSEGLSVVTAVHGIGGVGKTQLAARFFRDHQAEFDFAMWVDMRERDGLADLETVADALGLTAWADDVAEAVTNHIRGSGASWLMVFDNAESPSQVERLLVQAPNVTVVVTSRYRSWQRFGNTVTVDVFDPDTAVMFLADQSGRIDDPDAQRLAAALGFLPLALSLAGAYVQERAITFATYLEDVLPAGLRQALSPDDPTSYDRTVDAIWEESLYAVSHRDPQCRALIELMSVIDWTSIDRAWLKQRLGDERQLYRRLGLLSSYSLIRLTDTTIGITHNLVADGIADRVGDRTAEMVTALFDGALPPASAELHVQAQAAEPIRHLQRLLSDHGRLVTEDLTDTILRATNQLNQQGSVSQAFHRRVAEHCELHHGPDHPNTLTARNNLAGSYSGAGRNDEAITIQEQVLADRERILGVDHPDTLRARNNLAGSYSGAGRNDEAITIQEQVLADRERILGVDHPDTLTARNNLAGSYSRVGRSDEAITIREQVLADYERILGVDHPDTLMARSNLAYSYSGVGRNDEAITIQEQVLADRERILGVDHPDTLMARSNLAYSYSRVGRNDEAITIQEQVLADRERILGVDHPDTLTARSNLAYSYSRVGRNDEAITIQEQVLADYERILGVDHPDTLMARSNLAYSYSRVSRNDEAITIQEQVLADRERILGVDHPDTLMARSNLAYSYSRVGRNDEAITIQEQVLADRERILGVDHPDTLRARSNLAYSYSRVGRNDEAITIQEQVLADRERILGVDHPDTASLRQLIGNVRSNENGER